MKNGFKRTVAFILAAALILALAPMAFAQDPKAPGSADAGAGTLSAEVSGSDGVSALISDAIQDALLEETSSEGGDCRIAHLEVSGSEAQVTYQSDADARIIVALYDDEGRMVTSAAKNVLASDEETAVSIPIKDAPDYFTAKAYMLDAESGKPLCEDFTNNLYTESLQALEASTVSDYDEDLVLNLDGDKTTNFVVFNPGVITVEADGQHNVTTDLGGGAYRIENASDELLGMEAGDILSLKGADGSVLLIKLASIEKSGGTVTVTEDDSIALEDVFDVVKIEGGYDPTADTASLSGSELDANVTGKITKDIQLKKEFKRDKDVFDDNAPNITLSMKGSVTLTAYIKLYLSFKEQYVEAKITFDAEFDAYMSGATGRQTFDLLPEAVVFAPVAGVSISVMPSIVVDASLTLRFHAKLTAALGFAYTGDGFENRSEKPKVSDCDISLEGKLFLGFSLEPSVAVFSKKIGEVKLTATLGFTFTGEMKKDYVDHTHACDKCISGNVEFDVELSASAKFLGELDVSAKVLDIKHPLLDFYYSFTYEDWGFKKCPHMNYPITVRVWDVDENKNHTLRTGAKVEYFGLSTIDKTFSGTLTTDKNGTASVYLPDGTYDFSAENPDNGAFAAETVIVNAKGDENYEQTVELYLEEEVYIASVTVENEEGEKVSGAVIYGTGRDKDPVTNEYGVARIPLRVGTYHLSVSKDGSTPVALDEFKITGYDVVLPRVVIKEPRFKINVRILDEDWNAVSGTSVTVEETGETLKTDMSGRCTFTEKSGEYTLSAQNDDGSFTGTAAVNLNGRDKSAVIYMTKETVTVTVNAVSEENEPVANMPVMVNGLDSGVKTNELGKATFELDKGEYTFDISTSQWFGSEETEIKKNAEIKLTLKKSWMEWSFDSDTGKLSVWGEGAMPDYLLSAYGMPWAGYILSQRTGKWLTIIKSIEVSGLTHIGDYAFSHCLAASSVTLSDSVVSIGAYAFENCGTSYYTDNFDMTLPDSVVSIENRAFTLCGLKSVYIPASVRFIGGGAFQATAMTDFEVDPDNTAFAAVDGVLFTKDMTTLVEYPQGKSDTSYTVPSTVTEISEQAFYNSLNLTDISLPDSLKTIDASAFRYCRGLTHINIPNNVESIGDSAFQDCSSLTVIDLGSGVKRMGINVFYSCVLLSKVTIGRSFEGFDMPYYYERGLFTNCYALKEFEVDPENSHFYTDGKALFERSGDDIILIRYACADPAESYTVLDGVTEIFPYAFDSSHNLKKVVIADSVKKIGERAFRYMNNLDTLVIGESFKQAGSLPFCVDNLKTVVVRCSSTTNNGSSTFFNNQKSFSNIVYMGDAPAMYDMFKLKLSTNSSVPTKFYYPDTWDESLVPSEDKQSIYETWIPYDVSSYDPSNGLPE
ncbi:MAG: leucine-rich repeat protein [Clostridia bacterium]|nr:leucine-rich repeat protein [Clostridia bacterium]